MTDRSDVVERISARVNGSGCLIWLGLMDPEDGEPIMRRNNGADSVRVVMNQHSAEGGTEPRFSQSCGESRCVEPGHNVVSGFEPAKQRRWVKGGTFPVGETVGNHVRVRMHRVGSCRFWLGSWKAGEPVVYMDRPSGPGRRTVHVRPWMMSLPWMREDGTRPVFRQICGNAQCVHVRHQEQYAWVDDNGTVTELETPIPGRRPKPFC